MDDRRRELAKETIARLTGLTRTAVSTLDHALYDRQPAVRLRAADLILRHNRTLAERPTPPPGAPSGLDPENSS